MSDLVSPRYLVVILSVNSLTYTKFLFIKFFVILMSSVKRFPIFVFLVFNRLTSVNSLKYFNLLTGIDYQTFDDYPDA